MKASVFIMSGDLNNKAAKNCLRSVKKHTDSNLVREIIVLEAGIRSDFSHAHEINKIMKVFDGDVLVLLDDDVIVHPGWLKGLMDSASAGAGIVGAVLEDGDGSIIHTGAIADEKRFGACYQDAISTPRHVPFACSAVMLITRGVIEKIGLFDVSFEKYAQETDYCYRAREAGIDVVCTPHSRAVHLVGATIDQRTDKQAVWERDRKTFEDKWKDSPVYRNFDISRRGVTYPTMACNINCCFCYYIKESERKHRPLEEMQAEVDRMRNEYHLDYVDITGGEPTIYKHIVPLVEHCARIGLLPTVITNGQRPDVIEELIQRGLEDMLISVHGFEDDCNLAMNTKNGYSLVMDTIERARSRNFGFRTNTTLISHNYKNLPKLAAALVKAGPRIANFICFNPHGGTTWTHESDVDFQIPYSQLAPYVKEAIDCLTEAGIWANIRYFPLCQLQGYEKHVCNLHQWQWDPHEWEYKSGLWLDRRRIKKMVKSAIRDNTFGISKDGKLHLWIARNTACKGNVFFEACSTCANRQICDGIYAQYARRFGGDEFLPVEGFAISDPLYYRRQNPSWSRLKARSQQTK